MLSLLLVKEIGVMVWIGFFWLKVCSTVISLTSGSRKARGFLEPFLGVSVSFRRELWRCLALVVLTVWCSARQKLCRLPVTTDGLSVTVVSPSPAVRSDCLTV